MCCAEGEMLLFPRGKTNCSRTSLSSDELVEDGFVLELPSWW